MINYSIIQKSQLEGSYRLDAEYYKPEHLKTLKTIKEFGSNSLSSMTEFIRSGPFGSNLLCDTYIPNGVVVIRPFNLKDLNVNSGELVSISKEDCVNQHLHKYKNEDVFFARVGDVRFGIAEGFIDEITISPNIIAVRVRKESLDPYFLTVFLGSKYGYLQVERGLKVVAQPTIETDDVRKLMIPKIKIEKQIEIGRILKSSFNQKSKSKNLYEEAESLLLEELGLRGFQVKNDLTFIVNLSDINSVKRIDAEYFQPKYQKLVEQIKKNNAMLFGDLISMKKGFEPGSEAYEEEGKFFIRVSSVSKFGINDKDQKYLSEDLYKKLQKDFEPKIGEILLTKDATPGIAYVLKEVVEGIISGGILRLKVKDHIDPEYLALCISSIIGQWQAERDAGGSIIAHWKPEQIKNLLIPVLPKETQEKIAELVRKSHEARKKSKELLEEAKGQVEEMIEKGGRD